MREARQWTVVDLQVHLIYTKDKIMDLDAAWIIRACDFTFTMLPLFKLEFERQVTFSSNQHQVYVFQSLPEIKM